MNENNQMNQSPVDQHIWNLVNGSIDGELSADEQQELDRLLLSSDSVKKLDADLRVITKILDGLPEVEAPRYLQNAIERQVRLPVANDGKSSSGVLRGWLGAAWLRPGLALAAAAVLTIGIYDMNSRSISTRDSENLSGTIVKRQSSVLQGVLVDSVHFEVAKVKGSAELRVQDELFALDVQLNSEGPVETVMSLAGSGLDFAGAAPAGEAADIVTGSDGVIRLASSGEQHFTLKLKRISAAGQGAPIDLKVFADDVLVQQAELIISGL